jgi:hypothetical protein
LEIERSCITALPQTEDSETRANIFDYGVIQSKVRSQDLYLLFGGNAVFQMIFIWKIPGCTSTPKLQDYLWEWFRKNYNSVIKRYGSANDGIFLHIFGYSAENQSTDDFAKEFEKFFESEFDGESKASCKRTYNQALESIRLNARLFQTHAPSIQAFLSR